MLFSLSFCLSPRWFRHPRQGLKLAAASQQLGVGPPPHWRKLGDSDGLNGCGFQTQGLISLSRNRYLLALLDRVWYLSFFFKEFCSLRSLHPRPQPCGVCGPWPGALATAARRSWRSSLRRNVKSEVETGTLERRTDCEFQGNARGPQVWVHVSIWLHSGYPFLTHRHLGIPSFDTPQKQRTAAVQKKTDETRPGSS